LRRSSRQAFETTIGKKKEIKSKRRGKKREEETRKVLTPPVDAVYRHGKAPLINEDVHGKRTALHAFAQLKF
jgi:hypothetical protein